MSVHHLKRKEILREGPRVKVEFLFDRHWALNNARFAGHARDRLPPRGHLLIDAIKVLGLLEASATFQLFQSWGGGGGGGGGQSK